MSNWLFVISNPCMPGYTKISQNSVFPLKILRNLDLTGASPLAYQLAFKIWLKNDVLFIINQIRRELWSRLTNAAQGWFRVNENEAIEIVRNVISLHILRKYHYEIRGNCGNSDPALLLRVIGSVLDINGDQQHSYDAVSCFEEREILKIVAIKMEDDNWMKNFQLSNTLFLCERNTRRC